MHDVRWGSNFILLYVDIKWAIVEKTMRSSLNDLHTSVENQFIADVWFTSGASVLSHCLYVYFFASTTGFLWGGVVQFLKLE